MKRFICWQAAFILAFGIISCTDQIRIVDPLYQFEKDVEAIDAFLLENNIEHEKHVSGVRMQIHELGTGLPAYTSNTVNVEYRGYLFSNGVEFDSAEITRPLSGLIRGWQYALMTLPEGSKATVYIPSYHGYGQAPSGEIPANSILVFELEFKDVQLNSIQLEEFEKDTTEINEYLASNNIDATLDPTGFSYVVTQTGTGPSPTWYDKIKTRYTIKALSNDDLVVRTVEQQPSDTFDGRVIDYMHAMKVMFQKMSVGSKATLYVPAALGYNTSALYNSSGRQVLPANSNIIVELELLEILPE